MTDGFKRPKFKAYLSRFVTYGKRKAVSDSGPTSKVTRGLSIEDTESSATIAGSIPDSELPPNDPVKVLALASSNHTPPINTQVLNEPSLEATGSSMTF